MISFYYVGRESLFVNVHIIYSSQRRKKGEGLIPFVFFVLFFWAELTSVGLSAASLVGRKVQRPTSNAMESNIDKGFSGCQRKLYFARIAGRSTERLNGPSPDRSSCRASYTLYRQLHCVLKY